MDEQEFLDFFENGEDGESIDCEHKNTSQCNGTIICSDCGMELEQIYVSQDNYSDAADKKFYRKKTQNSEGGVSHDCRIRGFTDEISDMADRKYQIMMQKAIDDGVPETHRSNPRRALICSCIFFSMMSKELVSITLSEIGAKFGIIQQTKLGAGKEIYLRFFPEDKNIRQKPIDLIPNVMMKADISLEYLSKVEGIMRALENRSTVINASQPMSVAATMVFIFLKLNPALQKMYGYDQVKVFAKKIKMSNITVNKKSECGLAILHEMQRIKNGPNNSSTFSSNNSSNTPEDESEDESEDELEDELEDESEDEG